MDVRAFFEKRLRENVVRSFATECHGIGRCVFEITGERGGKWALDFDTHPPQVIEGVPSNGDCSIKLAADDFMRMVVDPSLGQVLAWQGKLTTNGDRHKLRRVADVLFPPPRNQNSAYLGYYTSLSRLVPDPRFTFMNHGYSEEHEDFRWLKHQDQPWRYSINLIRHVLKGVVVREKELLDVGCGRGGPSSYILRYLQPGKVIGLDACEDAIQFCQERHRCERLRFVVGYAGELPFVDQSFDIILNVESSHCYPDRPRFFREVARLLRPGGLFCYADIFNQNEFEHAKHLLSQMNTFRLVRVMDITTEVIRAIDRNRATLSGILTAAIDPTLRNDAIVHNLLHSIHNDIYWHYVSRQWLYHSWLIENTVA